MTARPPHGLWKAHSAEFARMAPTMTAEEVAAHYGSTINRVHRQGLAAAFGLHEPWPPQWAPAEVTHHRFGLWNCQDDGFYRFVYHHVRTTEGPAWLTNDRTPAQLLQW